MIWCWAAEVNFLPPAQPRVLPALPSRLSCLQPATAWNWVMLKQWLCLMKCWVFPFKKAQNVRTSNKLGCDLTTIPVIYRVLNSEDCEKQEAKQLHQGLSQMPANSDEKFLSTSEDVRSSSVIKPPNITIPRGSFLLSKCNWKRIRHHEDALIYSLA